MLNLQEQYFQSLVCYAMPMNNDIKMLEIMKLLLRCKQIHFEQAFLPTILVIFNIQMRQERLGGWVIQKSTCDHFTAFLATNFSTPSSADLCIFHSIILMMQVPSHFPLQRAQIDCSSEPQCKLAKNCFTFSR